MADILPISAIVPTRNRAKVLYKTLASISQQSCQPVELILVDGSDDEDTKILHENILSKRILNPALLTDVYYYRALEIGAASQRNQAMIHATQKVIWFLDDDILLEPYCLQRLWTALESDKRIGAVNAMITNQCYFPPGKFSKMLFQFLHGRTESSYAGKCIGPALNLLPEDREDLPEVVSVEWLNTTCTLYRKAVLPDPPFPDLFYGYSLMEDLALSLVVGKCWKLMNARTARIFHDSQPGDHKKDVRRLAHMELINRHFVMTKVLERKNISDYGKLMILQLFQGLASLQSLKGWKEFPSFFLGKITALLKIFSSNFT